ncbi:FCPF [Symbiodinium sp. CCMP2592]|nr:FCPF [Symbiodinium sp. CCMP2592]
MAPRSSSAALAVAASAAGAASMAFVASAPSSAGAARQSRVQGASAATSGVRATSSIAPIVGTAALATGATVLAQLSTSRRQARVAMGSGLMSPGYNTLPEWEKPKNGFEGLNGDQAPLGFWDPLGLSKDQDVEVFKRRRETEIKHGRVAMFATIGYIVPEYYKFPGLLSPSQGLKFADVPNGLKALSVVPKEGWAQILAFAGFIELVVNKKTSEPGNYGKGFLGLGAVGFGSSINDPTLRAKKLSAEIANGRLAMMAIIGMFFQDGLTGSAWGDWALYTDSPLRAFEDETGVQAPVGFWDPLGLSASGNVSDFKRRREVELKHGRVAMFATIGYILPEYWRFPGYLSKYLDIKFADVPNGLSAFSKVPAFGWLQIVGFAGIVEIQVYNEQIKDEPGNYGAGFLGLRSIGIMNTGIEDPEVRKKKLNAELANGRLAMMAIIGMFFQDGLTGSAWGDWANYTASPLRAFEEELGVQAPVGFWDPVGYTRDGSVETFKRRRETEIKHGRVAMYATIGYIVPEYFKWPGFLSPSLGLKFSDVPNGLAAISKVPGAGWAQIVAFAGYYELFVYKFKGEPGAYGWKAITSADPEGLKKKLNAEIANGRLAMMAIIGMFFQDGLTGSAWGDWANYTDSPLRAFEEELGVQAPVGFWDPVGYTRDGSVETFKRRRETEIKHGRVAMYATVGYIVPEYFKWPGFLSPSLGLKFSDVPNGLAAISKVPGAGWAQIVAFAGYYELFVYKFKGEPGAYGWKAITSPDPEGRKKKLNAELANGRLAMMAIIGMFFQDGLTGSAWGDWSLYTDSPLR